MSNSFAHIELSTDNLASAKKFYGALFSWKLKDEAMDQGGAYTMVDTGAQPGGGMMKSPMPGMPPYWMPYVAVPDVKKAMAKATSLGAKAIVPFMQIGTHGAIGVFTDPQGATLGLWQAPPAAKKPAKKAAAKKATKAAKPAKKAAKPAKKAAKPAKKAAKKKK